MNSDEFTHKWNNTNQLLPVGVQWRSLYVDNQTINVPIGGGSIGPGIRGAETYKLRDKSFREQLTVALANDHIDVCVAVLWNLSAVEASACTGIARRASLFHALECDSVRRYLQARPDLY